MSRLFLLSLSLAGGLHAATLITASDFTSPTVATFTSNSFSTNPSFYTEAGASFRNSTSGAFFATLGGYLSVSTLFTNNGGTAPLDVVFPSLMDRFGFIGNPNPNRAPIQITSVTLYSDTAMTSVTETYTTPFQFLTQGVFFGLQQEAGSFAAARIVFTTVPNTSGNSPTLDDFRFEADSVPEPASLSLLGFGAGCLVLAWRRRAGVTR
ncbi:MAG: PEP-CTERM sorting domain-containing protein [Acidobacteria bacterium]|nr:PEP-CTERM sorting domain-containing protein [Acidobacteriota bacterium]